ncbi:MAG: hemerythrin domain-containing protein [Nitrospirota bacterium]
MKQETIFDLMTTDHEKVKDIFDEIEATRMSSMKTREKLLLQLKSEILPHMHAEEEFFYPLLMENQDEDGKIIMYEAYAEHKNARFALAEVEKISPEDPRWIAEVQVLAEQVRHHIKEEEGKVFKLASQVLDKSTSESLAQQFHQIKMEKKAA